MLDRFRRVMIGNNVCNDVKSASNLSRCTTKFDNENIFFFNLLDIC